MTRSSRTSALAASDNSAAWELAIQRQVDLEHVHRRSAHEAKPPRSGVLLDQPLDRGGVGAALPGDPRRLQAGVGDADVRIESAAAGGNGVRGNDRRVGRGAPDRGEY